MRFEGPVPTRNDVLTIVWALHLETRKPVTTTQVMGEARRRGFQGWHSAYARRLQALVSSRHLGVGTGATFVPIGDLDDD